MGAENRGIDDKLFNYIRESLAKTPYYNLLGINLTELGPGWARLTVIADHRHTNPLGMTHGGLFMSLADAAMGNAVRSLGITAVTVECSSSFVASAGEGAIITGWGKVLKAGKNMIFAESEIRAGEKLVTASKAIFFKIDDIHY